MAYGLKACSCHPLMVQKVERVKQRCDGSIGESLRREKERERGERKRKRGRREGEGERERESERELTRRGRPKRS